MCNTSLRIFTCMYIVYAESAYLPNWLPPLLVLDFRLCESQTASSSSSSCVCGRGRKNASCKTWGKLGHTSVPHSSHSLSRHLGDMFYIYSHFTIQPRAEQFSPSSLCPLHCCAAKLCASTNQTDCYGRICLTTPLFSQLRWAFFPLVFVSSAMLCGKTLRKVWIKPDC